MAQNQGNGGATGTQQGQNTLPSISTAPSVVIHGIRFTLLDTDTTMAGNQLTDPENWSVRFAGLVGGVTPSVIIDNTTQFVIRANAGNQNANTQQFFVDLVNNGSLASQLRAEIVQPTANPTDSVSFGNIWRGLGEPGFTVSRGFSTTIGASVNEENPLGFRAFEFNFADADAGDTLASIRIVTLPTVGRFTLNGADVTAEQVITTAEIPNLRFIPANRTANYDTSFTYRVIDSNGGESTDTGTFTISVIADDDGLRFIFDTATPQLAENADTTAAIPVTTFTLADPDAATQMPLTPDAFTITGDTDNRFEVVAGSGANEFILRTIAGAVFDHEVTPSIALTLAAEGVSQTITITITDFDEPPIIANPVGNLSFAQGSSDTIDISTLFTDPEETPLTLTVMVDGLAITHANNSWIAFDATMGVLTLAQPDATRLGAHTVQITASDEGGQMTVANFTLIISNADVSDAENVFYIRNLADANAAITLINPTATPLTQWGNPVGNYRFDNTGTPLGSTEIEGALSGADTLFVTEALNTVDGAFIFSGAGGADTYVITRAFGAGAADSSTAEIRLADVFGVSTIRLQNGLTITDISDNAFLNWTVISFANGAEIWVRRIYGGGEESQFLLGDDAETPLSRDDFFTMVGFDSATGVLAQNITIGAPTLTALGTGAIIENTAAETPTGITLTVANDTGSLVEGDFTVYENDGMESNRFAVVSDGGVWRLALLADQATDFESDDDDTGTAGTQIILGVEVRNGTLASPRIEVRIALTDANDAPTIDTNAGLTVDEGGTVGISQSILTASDVDPGDGVAQITYTITTAPAHGEIRVGGVMVSSFTQAEINMGRVQYIHNGGEEVSDSFTFTVEDDEAATSSPQNFAITITPVNDAPVVTTLAATLAEGGTLTLNLTALDNDDMPAGITYTITALPTNGRLELNTMPVAMGDSFTQADITMGLVQYIHDGGEARSDSFSFTVEDGNEDNSPPATQNFTLTITNVNDAPTVAQAIPATTLFEDSGAQTIALAGVFADTDNDSLSLSLVTAVDSTNADVAGNFSIMGTNLLVATDDLMQGDYTITIQASDDAGETISTQFTLTIDRPIPNITIGGSGAFSLGETASSMASTVDTINLSATGFTASDFTLSDPRFAVTAVGGSATQFTLSVVEGQSFDFEQEPSLTLTVGVNGADQDFTITITDAANLDIAINPDDTALAQIGTVAITDSDGEAVAITDPLRAGDSITITPPINFPQFVQDYINANYPDASVTVGRSYAWHRVTGFANDTITIIDTPISTGDTLTLTQAQAGQRFIFATITTIAEVDGTASGDAFTHTAFYGRILGGDTPSLTLTDADADGDGMPTTFTFDETSDSATTDIATITLSRMVDADRFTLSDARFEVVAGSNANQYSLRVAEAQVFDFETEPNITLTLRLGDASEDFTITIANLAENPAITLNPGSSANVAVDASIASLAAELATFTITGVPGIIIDPDNIIVSGSGNDAVAIAIRLSASDLSQPNAPITGTGGETTLAGDRLVDGRYGSFTLRRDNARGVVSIDYTLAANDADTIAIPADTTVFERIELRLDDAVDGSGDPVYAGSFTIGIRRLDSSNFDVFIGEADGTANVAVTTRFSFDTNPYQITATANNNEFILSHRAGQEFIADTMETISVSLRQPGITVTPQEFTVTVRQGVNTASVNEADTYDTFTADQFTMGDTLTAITITGQPVLLNTATMLGSLSLAGGGDITQPILRADIPNLRFTPANRASDYAVEFTYRVMGSDTDSSFVIRVAASDDAPTRTDNMPADQTVDEGSALTPYDITPLFTDPDGDDSLLIYEFTAMRDGMAVDISAWLSLTDGVFRVAENTTDNDDVGIYSISVTAEDAAGVASQSAQFTLTLANVNDAPSIDYATDLASDGEASLTEGTSASTSTTTATGTLNFADVDTATAELLLQVVEGGTGINFRGASHTVAGTYGRFTLTRDDVAGTLTWVYTLDNGNADTNALAAGTIATDTLTLRVNDGMANSATDRTITITITGSADSPQIANVMGGAITDGGNPMLMGDFAVIDDRGDSHRFSIQGQAGTLVTGDADAGYTVAQGGVTYGSLTLNQDNGIWQFTADTSGLASLNMGEMISLGLTAVVTDAATPSLTDSAAFTITLNGVNTAPVISPVANSTLADDAASPIDAPSTGGTLTATDADDGDALTFSFGGQDNTATVVTGDAAQGYTIALGGRVYGTIALNASSGVWGFTADAVSLNALRAGDSVLLSLVANAADTEGAVASDAFTITLTGANDAPDTPINNGADTAVTEDDMGDSTASGQLSATDPEGDRLTFRLTQGETVQGTYGTLALNPNGAWVYTIDNTLAVFDGMNLGSGATMMDSFSIEAFDGTAASATALMLEITVNGADEPPIRTLTAPTDQSFAEGESGSFSIANLFSDLDNTALTYLATIDGRPHDDDANDWIEFDTATGIFTIANNAADDAEVGVHSISVTASDGVSTSPPAEFTLTITNINDAPFTGGDGEAEVAEGGTVTLVPADFGVSDADDTADGINYTITTLPQHGTLRVGGMAVTDTANTFTQQDIDTLNVTYTHNGGEGVRDTFSFTIDDGNEDGSPPAIEVFSITITAANDAPTVTAGSASIDEDTPHEFAAEQFGFADVDAGDALASITIITLPDMGILALNGTAVTAGQVIAMADIASLRFTPENRTGDYDTAFQYTVSDGTSDSVPATFTLTVTADNDAPTVATPIGMRSVNEDSGTAFISLGAVFADADIGDSLSFSVVTATATSDSRDVSNEITVVGSNLVIDSDDLTQGQYMVTVRATDSGGAMVDDTLTLTITPPIASNTPPTASDATASIDEGATHAFAASQFNFADSDSDPALNALSAIRIVTLPSIGSLTLNGNAVRAGDVIERAFIADLLFTPEERAANYDAVFTFRVRDNAGGESTDAASFTITVAADDDAPQITLSRTAFALAETGDSSATTIATVTVTDPEAAVFGTGDFTISDNRFGVAATATANQFTVGLLADQVFDHETTETLTLTLTVGGADQDIIITVTDVNEAPSLNYATSQSVDGVGAVVEDADTAATGTIAFGDADAGDPNQSLILQVNTEMLTGAMQTVAGTYGDFTFTRNDASGLLEWEYRLRHDDANVGALTAGQRVMDSVTVSINDGEATAPDNRPITISITGANDAPMIGSIADGVVADVANSADDTPVTGGTFTASDDDAGAMVRFSLTAQTGTDISGDADSGYVIRQNSTEYGTIALNATTGVWLFTANAASLNALFEGERITLGLTAIASDSTNASNSGDFTITLNGANENPVPTPIGTVTVTDTADAGGVAAAAFDAEHSDADNSEGENTARPATYSITAGSDTILGLATGTTDVTVPVIRAGILYGDFTYNTADGTGSFTPNQAALDALDLGATVTLNINFIVTDAAGGRASDAITIELVGANDTPDAPTLNAGADAQVTEDDSADATATGVLTASDRDDGEVLSYRLMGGGTTATGAYGSLTVDASGTWTYTLDNTTTDLASLGDGETATDTFMLVAWDGAAQSTPYSLSITINGADENIAPTPPPTATSDATLFNGLTGIHLITLAEFTDADNDAIAYSAGLSDGGSLPTGFAFDASTRTLAVNTDTADTGRVTIRFTATDDGAGNLNSFIDLVVRINSQGNTAPIRTAEAVPSPVFMEGEAGSFSISALFTDAENDPLTYRASLQNGDALPEWIGFDWATGDFTIAAGASDDDTRVGAFALRVVALDASLDSPPADFTLTITNVNDTPSLTYSGDVASDGMGIVAENAADNTASGTLIFADSDDSNATLVITANTESGSTLASLTPTTADSMITDGQSIAGRYGTFSFMRDNTSGALTWIYTLDNANAAVDALHNGAMLFDRLNLVIADDAPASSPPITATVTITGANDAPVVAGVADIVLTDSTDGSDASLTSGALMGTLTATDDMTASGAITFGFEAGAGTVITGADLSTGVTVGDGTDTYGTLTLNASQGWQFTPDYTAINSLDDGATITLGLTATATDDDATPLTGTADFTITLIGRNDAPTAAQNGSVTIGEDATHAFTADQFGFSDRDRGDALTSITITSQPTLLNTATMLGSLSLVGGGDVTEALMLADIANLRFTPANDRTDDYTVSFTYTVNDGTTDSTDATFTIMVTADDDAPMRTAVMPVNQQALEGAMLADYDIKPLFQDPDGDDTALTYSYTAQRNGAMEDISAWLTLTDGVFSIAADATDDAETGVYTISVSARDNSTASPAAVFTLTIANVNEAPTAIALIPASLRPGQVVTPPLTVTDPDDTAGFSFAFAVGAGDTDNSRFSIDANTGALTLNAGSARNLGENYNLLIQVTDSGGAASTHMLQFISGGVFLTSSDFSGEAYSGFTDGGDGLLAENANGSTTPITLGLINSADINATRFALTTPSSANNNALFAIDVGGNLQFIGTDSGDFEAGESLRVEIESFDMAVGGTSLGTEIYIVNLANVDEAPIITQPNAVVVAPGAMQAIDLTTVFNDVDTASLSFGAMVGGMAVDNMGAVTGFSLNGAMLRIDAAMLMPDSDYSVVLSADDGVNPAVMTQPFMVHINTPPTVATPDRAVVIDVSEVLVLDRSHLNAMDSDASDTPANLTYTVTGGNGLERNTASTGQPPMWTALAQNDSFTQQDVIDGAIRLNPMASGASTARGEIALSLADADGSVVMASLEFAVRLIEDGVNTAILGGGTVDYQAIQTMLTAAMTANDQTAIDRLTGILETPRFVQTGIGNNAITTGTGDDIIDAGAGDDVVDLRLGGADEVIYRFEPTASGGGFVARDGGDRIMGFTLGEDSLTLQSTGAMAANADTLTEFIAGLGTAFDVRFDYTLTARGGGTDLIHYDVTGIELHFPQAVLLPGGRLSGSILEIDLATPIAWNTFLTDAMYLGGSDAFDAANLQLMGNTAGREALARILGLNDDSVSTDTSRGVIIGTEGVDMLMATGATVIFGRAGSDTITLGAGTQEVVYTLSDDGDGGNDTTSPDCDDTITGFDLGTDTLRFVDIDASDNGGNAPTLTELLGRFDGVSLTTTGTGSGIMYTGIRFLIDDPADGEDDGMTINFATALTESALIGRLDGITDATGLNTVLATASENARAFTTAGLQYVDDLFGGADNIDVTNTLPTELL